MKALLVILASLLPVPALPQPAAGAFDYYILALSWQPEWCRSTGTARGAPECSAGAGQGFTVHGLWPQYNEGWPEFCDTPKREPSRRQVAAIADLMAPGLASYQWRKHGSCSGLSAEGYLDAFRRARAAVTIPPELEPQGETIRISSGRIEEAFLKSNPQLDADGVTIRCRDGALTEIRICLTRDLEPRNCAPDARRDCTGSGLRVEAPR